MTNQDRAQIQRALDNHEYLKPSYWWSNLGNAASRRSQEKQRNFTITVEHEGDVYRYTSSVRISTKNFYYTGRFTKNDVKGNVRLFKNLLKKG